LLSAIKRACRKRMLSGPCPLYDHVPVGGGLMVRYVPDNPHICRADTTQ
jgi:hypothetical protein